MRLLETLRPHVRHSAAAATLLLAVITAVAGSVVLVFGLLLPRSQPNEAAESRYVAQTPRAAAAGLRIEWVSLEHADPEISNPLVELKILISNAKATATKSTTIMWSPAFKQHYDFLGSDPRPWRVRQNERGWGIVDTAGILPRQWGTFILRFRARTDRVVNPDVIVLANGDLMVGRWQAWVVHLESLPYRQPPDPFGQGIVPQLDRLLGGEALPLTGLVWGVMVLSLLLGATLAIACGWALVSVAVSSAATRLPSPKLTGVGSYSR